jgi:hypothetical protein
MAREAIAGPDAVETWAKNAKNAQKDLNMSAVEYIELYEKYGHNYLTGDAYEKTKQIANANVSVEEYILARKNTVDTDKSGGINKDEFIAALNARNFTQSEKRQIFSILHPTWKNPF